MQESGVVKTFYDPRNEIRPDCKVEESIAVETKLGIELIESRVECAETLSVRGISWLVEHMGQEGFGITRRARFVFGQVLLDGLTNECPKCFVGHWGAGRTDYCVRFRHITKCGEMAKSREQLAAAEVAGSAKDNE